MTAFGMAKGRVEGIRRRVRDCSVIKSTKNFLWMRLVLECGHVTYRRQDHTHPIWAFCSECRTLEQLVED